MFLLMIAVAGSTALNVPPPRVLEADVELSEFTPPRRLMLDLISGKYEIVTPPEATWPAHLPHPADNAGNVPAPRLAAIRSAFNAALLTGLGYPGCDRRKLRLRELVISNAPVPVITLRVGERRLIAPRDWSCLTPAARRLQGLVDRNVEGVSR